MEDANDSCKDTQAEMGLDAHNKAHNGGNEAWYQGNTNGDYGTDINTVPFG